MSRPAPPPPTELTYGQYSGWNCCWCNASLQAGGVSAGVSQGGIGAHGLDVEVYECGPRCPERPRRTAKTDTSGVTS
ncbi:hypothetical protein MQE23_08295 [Streptomyces sp. HP-A2021]|uniref:hypothetical protein n=1 Tax=Streptomyces sp. HP-A2021 TaxID=2927875 RepID=UPI001FAE9407|nr:hypothetical protein [Streptomyces sp. HP-A2021]UOB09050.1 hypothetical protein MQE23_08295 [Streptomyces sp. HP-A2021]